ncbi:hypothetical protein PV11_04788 [Exophiala sideris]|uniref:Heterokaryon incompatibility domain-containing protein n=1 Tax=Exophiala sideris TaxID=1016849 RepID=A0A0D1Z769_9EURO|nr:hypothetical protein PV11_04788 [Exophiala sideris]
MPVRRLTPFPRASVPAKTISAHQAKEILTIMRLINTTTLEFQEFFGNHIPKYAILSHTWGEGEVSYQDWQDVVRQPIKNGFFKIWASCDMARHYSLDYLWVDTNCINKDSSAELTEAINSMFAWYQRSAVCFVYLEDFDYGTSGLAYLGFCRYWTRGWTLQELLAPPEVHFFNPKWQPIGTKESLMDKLSKITHIESSYLKDGNTVRKASIACRMSWAAYRSTTRAEDMAYCLMGIFGVNMPLLYGEGERAFSRLQEAIIQHNNDQTIFCWSQSPWTRQGCWPWGGCLAPHPMTFRDSGGFKQPFSDSRLVKSDFQLTNSGLRINLLLLTCFLRWRRGTLAMLDAQDVSAFDCRLCICLTKKGANAFYRSDELLRIPRAWPTVAEEIYLLHNRDVPQISSNFPTTPSSTRNSASKAH